MTELKDEQRRDAGKHFCTLDSVTALPFQKDVYLSSFKHTLKIWKNNPNMKFFYKNLADIEEECKWKGYLIHPFSFFTYVWETLQLWVLLLGLFISPLNYIYGPMITPTLVHIGLSPLLEGIEIFVDTLYLIDFILIMNTGFIDNDNRRVYMTYKEILRHRYRSKMFYIDVISVFSITAIAKMYIDKIRPEENLSWVFYAKFVSFTKMLRIVRFIRYFRHFRTSFRRAVLIPECILSTLILFIILHTITCIYIMTSQYIEMYNTVDDMYIYSFEMDMIIIKPFTYMYAQGYGTIVAVLLGVRQGYQYVYVPNNMTIIWIRGSYLYLLLSLIGMFMSTMFAILVIQMLNIQTSSEVKYYAVLFQVRTFMNRKRLPDAMQDRIIRYYHYRFSRRYYKPSVVHKHLSDTLTREIYLHSCRSLIEVVPILKELQQDIRDKLITHLQYCIYLNKDTIIHAGDNDTCMYFISRGSVAVYTTTGHEICHLQDGAFFGEVALILPGQKRTATVVAIEICEVYRLDRAVFFKCFDDASQFYKKMESTARTRYNKTGLLEELHRKYLMDHTKTKNYKPNYEMSHVL